MRTRIRFGLAVTIALTIVSPLIGDDAGKASPSTQPSTQPAAKEPSENQKKARERMKADAAKYSREQLREIEALYQPSNDRSRRGAPEIKAALEKLIAKEPECNRAGCAVLYLAQWADGEERERLLKLAYEKHGNDYYGDGCQIGPYARFQLAQWYDKQQQPEKAKQQRGALRADHADATDHRGVTLVSQFAE